MKCQCHIPYTWSFENGSYCLFKIFKLNIWEKQRTNKIDSSIYWFGPYQTDSKISSFLIQNFCFEKYLISLETITTLLSLPNSIYQNYWKYILNVFSQIQMALLTLTLREITRLCFRIYICQFNQYYVFEVHPLEICLYYQELNENWKKILLQFSTILNHQKSERNKH